MNWRKIPSVLYKQFAGQKGKRPSRQIPVLAFDRESFLARADRAKIIWYGHSAMLIRMAGQTVLIDPMLGPDTTPIAPIASRRFSDGTLDLIEQFPDVDVALITHDHYDHLDYDSICLLDAKVARFWVGLGVKRHLVRWGVDASRVEEFDWYDHQSLGDLTVTYTPTRHFSGRGLTDRDKCLWGGWSLRTDDEHIWFSGDGGYGQHFKEIGERIGPVDFGMMECGQYNEDWVVNHMFPHESIQAALDVGVRRAMPIHWAGFALSYYHTWSQPAIDFVKYAQEHSLPYLLPRIGQRFDYLDEMTDPWWAEFE